MKILITTGIYPPEIGGPATYTALLEKEMPKRGINVSVLPFRTVRHLPKVIKHFVFLCKVLNLGRKADLLYTQDPVSVGFPTMLASKILGKPFLARIAGDWAWEQATQRFSVSDNIDDFQNKKYGLFVELLRFIQKTTTAAANKVITPSKYFCNLVAGWNPTIDNVITIYNGIDPSVIPESALKFEPKTLISAGRLVPWKGFDSLIEMIKELPDWKLFIAGDGPDRARLSKLVEDLSLGGRVFLLGQMDRGNLLRKIQECEIFILNTSFESFSFQIVEAMFVGTPVVSTNIGNISEIVQNGKDGLLVFPNNKKEILEAVQKLSKPPFRDQIVANAKAKARMFSVEKTMEKTSEVIFSLVQSQEKSFFKRNILLRYLLSGLTSALTQIGLLYVFTDIAGIWYIYSSVLAFVVAVAVSFTLQKFWTFTDRSVKKIHHQFAKYMGLAIFGLALNSVSMFVQVDFLGVWYILAQIITSAVIAFINFIAYKFFVFNK